MEVWIAEHHIAYEGSTLLGVFFKREDAEEFIRETINMDYYMDAVIDETSTTFYMKYSDTYSVEKHEVK